MFLESSLMCDHGATSRSQSRKVGFIQKRKQLVFILNLVLVSFLRLWPRIGDNQLGWKKGLFGSRCVYGHLIPLRPACGGTRSTCWWQLAVANKQRETGGSQTPSIPFKGPPTSCQAPPLKNPKSPIPAPARHTALSRTHSPQGHCGWEPMRPDSIKDHFIIPFLCH